MLRSDLIHVAFYKGTHKGSDESRAQSHIKGILARPQQIPVSLPLPRQMPRSLFQPGVLFRQKNPILLAASVTSTPSPSPVIQSHLPSSQECTSVTRSYSPSLLSPGGGALGSLGAVCVRLSQIYSSSVVKRDTGTSSVSTGLHFRLVYDKCHRLRTSGGWLACLGTNLAPQRHCDW